MNPFALSVVALSILAGAAAPPVRAQGRAAQSAQADTQVRVFEGVG